MSKTYTIAGISTLDGVKTFRFGNGPIARREAMLRFHNHENIKLAELPRAMSRDAAMAWVLENVRGAKGAILPTRAADKTEKRPAQLAVEARLKAKREKQRAAA